MNDAGAIRAGKAFVEVTTDDDGFKRSLDRTSRTFKAWGEGLSRAGAGMLTIGTTMTASLLAATKVFTSMGTGLVEMSEKTGITVEELSKLRYAAGQSGVEIEGLQTGLARMSRTLLSAAEGNGAANITLNELGLSIASLNKLSPGDRFVTLAEAISRVPDPSARAGLAMKVFGRQAADLLPLLNGGQQGIRALTDEAVRLGLVISTDDAYAARAFSQDISRLWDVLKSVAFVIGGTLDPVLKAQIKLLTSGAQIVRDFLREHRELISGVRIGASLMTVIGGALYGIGKAAEYVRPGLAALGAIASGSFGVLATVLAAAVSPLGLITIAAAAATIAFLKLTDAGQEVTKYLGEAFAGLKADAIEAFGGIRDALTAGDWKLAAQILWAMIRLEWAKGVGAVKELWAELKFFVVEKLADAAEGVERIWSYLVEYMSWDGMKNAASKFITWLKDTWSSLVNYLSDLWASLTGGTAKAAVQQRREAIVRAQYNAYKDIDRRQSSGEFTEADADKARKGAMEQADKARDVLEKETGEYDKELHGRRDAARRGQYEADQKALDDDFASKHGQEVTVGELRRMQIAAERERARREHEADLKQQLGNASDPAEIDRLKRELAELTKKASSEANNERIQAQNRAGLDDFMQRQAAGTFNKTALFGFGTNNTADRIARNTANTAEGIRILQQILRGGIPGTGIQYR